MSDPDFAARVRADTGITLSPAEAPELERLVGELNARVGAGAAGRLTLDAAPWSLASLWAQIAAEMKK